MRKVTVVILLLAIFFGAGYYLGSNRLTNLNRDISRLKGEMAEKASHFDQELKALRYRNHVMEARDKIHEAQRSLSERNFGNAHKAIRTAQEELQEAAKMAGPAEKERHSALSAELTEINADLSHPTRPRLRERMDQAAKDLEQLAGKK